MALRTIRIMGDPILRKKCKEVKDLTPRIRQLVEDMFETMYEDNGVGLAAPQVGILKRIVVLNVDGTPYVLINPEIISQSGEQTGYEGCLSIPGKVAVVKRPNEVTVKGLNENFEEVTINGTELLARAICHELEHLDGILYVDHMEGELLDVNDLPEDEEVID